MSTKTSRSLQHYRLFFIVLGAFCAVAIATNLVVRQGPVHDANAESDISNIANAIASGGGSGKATLPTSLDEIPDLPAGTKKRLGDYSYTIIAPAEYQICATFTAATQGNQSATKYYPSGGENPGIHGQGRQCFRFTVSELGPAAPGRVVPYNK